VKRLIEKEDRLPENGEVGTRRGKNDSYNRRPGEKRGTPAALTSQEEDRQMLSVFLLVWIDAGLSDILYAATFENEVVGGRRLH
jgi:hypothetical protein